jgi:hypothetical protein
MGRGCPARHCLRGLDRGVPDHQTLVEEVGTWEGRRNHNHTRADWQFTTADVRVKAEDGISFIMDDTV